MLQKVFFFIANHILTKRKLSPKIRAAQRLRAAKKKQKSIRRLLLMISHKKYQSSLNLQPHHSNRLVGCHFLFLNWSSTRACTHSRPARSLTLIRFGCLCAANASTRRCKQSQKRKKKSCSAGCQMTRTRNTREAKIVIKRESAFLCCSGADVIVRQSAAADDEKTKRGS